MEVFTCFSRFFSDCIILNANCDFIKIQKHTICSLTRICTPSRQYVGICIHVAGPLRRNSSSKKNSAGNFSIKLKVNRPKGLLLISHKICFPYMHIVTLTLDSKISTVCTCMLPQTNALVAKIWFTNWQYMAKFRVSVGNRTGIQWH